MTADDRQDSPDAALAASFGVSHSPDPAPPGHVRLDDVYSADDLRAILADLTTAGTLPAR